MIIFDKPNTLNGSQLRNELRAVGVEITDDIFAVSIDGNNKLVLDIDSKDKSKAQKVIDAHIAIDNTAAIAQAKAVAEGKLAALGLTTDDLRALGL